MEREDIQEQGLRKKEFKWQPAFLLPCLSHAAIVDYDGFKYNGWKSDITSCHQTLCTVHLMAFPVLKGTALVSRTFWKLFHIYYCIIPYIWSYIQNTSSNFTKVKEKIGLGQSPINALIQAG